MDTPPLIPGSHWLTLSCDTNIGGFLGDDAELSEASTSSSSELPSPDHDSSDGMNIIILNLCTLIQSNLINFLLEEIDEHGYNEEEFLGILALAQQSRELYARSGETTDLEDCIAYLRDALTVGPRDNRARADVLHKLAYDLYTYHLNVNGERSLENEDSLNESIELHRQALRLLPARHSARALYITRLAIALRARFTESGVRDDLRECISLHRMALSFRTPGHPDRSQSLLNLANAYWTSFELVGALEDLNHAIEFDTEALELRPHNHPNRTPALMGLATDLSARYMKTNDLGDLTRAIELEREASHLNPTDDHIAQALASLLVMRYHATQEVADFDFVTAICSAQSATSQDMEDDEPDGAAAFLHILVEINTAHYQHVGNSQCLVHAVQLCRQIPDMGECETAVFTVARVFVSRYQKDRNPSDFDGAVELCREALEACPPGHPHRALCLHTLAQAYEIYADIHRQNEDLDTALRYYSGAVQDVYSSIRDRFQYVQDWINLAEKTARSHSLLDACTASVHILARVVHFDEHVDIRAGALNWGPKLLNAILATIVLAPARAFEALEFARSLLWLLSLNPQRTPKLDGLSPILLQKLCRISWQLERGASSSPSSIRSLQGRTNGGSGTAGTDERGSGHSIVDVRRALVEEFDALVSDARSFPGYAGFVRPLCYSLLSNGWGENGLVAVLISTPQECRALVIFPTSIKPLDIVLPLTPAILNNLADGFTMAAQGNDETPYRALLGDVWEQVVKPIIQKLMLRVRRFYHIQAEIHEC